MSETSNLVGKIGRVTGEVKPGHIGEVTLHLGGGTQAFHAQPDTGQETFPVGTRVVVVDYQPPNTVYVTNAYGL